MQYCDKYTVLVNGAVNDPKALLVSNNSGSSLICCNDVDSHNVVSSSTLLG